MLRHSSRLSTDWTWGGIRKTTPRHQHHLSDDYRVGTDVAGRPLTTRHGTYLITGSGQLEQVTGTVPTLSACAFPRNKAQREQWFEQRCHRLKHKHGAAARILKARALIAEHKDNRSVVGRRYSEATTQSKPQMAATMMKRAMRSGIEADYVIADAWFGTKAMMRTALGLGMCAILRMKKSKMKYRAIIKGVRKSFSMRRRFIPVS